jgi:uncharacterized membrane-anchored protein YjiN (DUF445 family)
MAPTPADEQRRRGLRRMRTLAVSLLILAAVIFLATLRLPHDGIWGFVNAGAEGAMVGALADWFAVTALFRHPLGLPIPHTAIIPKRKNEIGRERLAAARVADRIGTWLGDPGNRHRAMVEIVRVSRAGLGRLSDDEVQALVRDFLLPRLVNEPISPIAGTLLEGIIDEQTHKGLVDLGLEELRSWLTENPGTFAAVVGERAPWWSPPWVDDKVINWSYSQVLTWLQEIHDDHHHPARRALDDLLRRLADDLQHDEEVKERAESLKEPHTAVGLWQSFKATLLAAMDDEESYFWVRGQELLEHAGRHLREDPAWRDRLEARMGEAVTFFVNTYGDELAEVISITVDRWDGKEAAERIELHVGRDLQFIRINGTIVGALAGVAIHAVATLV